MLIICRQMFFALLKMHLKQEGELNNENAISVPIFISG